MVLATPGALEWSVWRDGSSMIFLCCCLKKKNSRIRHTVTPCHINIQLRASMWERFRENRVKKKGWIQNRSGMISHPLVSLTVRGELCRCRSRVAKMKSPWSGRQPDGASVQCVASEWLEMAGGWPALHRFIMIYIIIIYHQYII